MAAATAPTAAKAAALAPAPRASTANGVLLRGATANGVLTYFVETRHSRGASVCNEGAAALAPRLSSN